MKRRERSRWKAQSIGCKSMVLWLDGRGGKGELQARNQRKKRGEALEILMIHSFTRKSNKAIV